MEMIRMTHPHLTSEHDTEVPESSVWILERSGWQRWAPPVADEQPTSKEPATQTDDVEKSSSRSRSASTTRTTAKKEDSE